MAKAILTFEDSEDGGFTVTSDFDPPMKMKDGVPQPTPAQLAGAEMINSLRQNADEVNEDDE